MGCCGGGQDSAPPKRKVLYPPEVAQKIELIQQGYYKMQQAKLKELSSQPNQQPLVLPFGLNCIGASLQIKFDSANSKLDLKRSDQPYKMAIYAKQVKAGKVSVKVSSMTKDKTKQTQFVVSPDGKFIGLGDVQMVLKNEYIKRKGAERQVRQESNQELNQGQSAPHILTQGMDDLQVWQRIINTNELIISHYQEQMSRLWLGVYQLSANPQYSGQETIQHQIITPPEQVKAMTEEQFKTLHEEEGQVKVSQSSISVKLTVRRDLQTKRVRDYAVAYRKKVHLKQGKKQYVDLAFRGQVVRVGGAEAGLLEELGRFSEMKKEAIAFMKKYNIAL